MSNKPIVIDETGFEPNEVERILYEPQPAAQGTEEWLIEKLGQASASNIKWVVIRDSKGKPYAKYYDYMLDLAIQRVTGKPVRFSNKYTKHGNEYEAWVASKYEEQTGYELAETTYLEHPELAAGVSRDRVIVDEPDGIVEIKAPNTTTMAKYMISAIPKDSEDYELVSMLGLKGYEWKEYYEQMQMQMWFGDHKWCDFTVGDPDWSEDGEIWIKRVERDDEYIKAIMEPRLIEFLDKVKRLEQYFRKVLGYDHE